MSHSPLRNYAEAAEYLRLSATELRRRVSAGQVTTVRFGRRVMFTQADLDAFIDAQRVTAGFAPASPRPARHLRAVAGGAAPNLDAIRKSR